MTLLGTITTDTRPQGAAFLVSLCGAHYKGTQITAQGWPNVVIFVDPVSHATILMSEPELTIGNIWRAMHRERERVLDAMMAEMDCNK
jgi:hypothetical protein